MPASPLLLFLMSVVVMINVYLAQRSSINRPGLFYAAATLMLFGALLAARRIG